MFTIKIVKNHQEFGGWKSLVDHGSPLKRPKPNMVSPTYRAKRLSWDDGHRNLVPLGPAVRICPLSSEEGGDL